MNEVETAELGRYIRWVANEMGMRDWHIDFKVTESLPEGGMENPDPDEFVALASCSPVPGQHRATLCIHPEFRDESAQKQREIIVHELIHCHLADMREFVRTGVSDHLTRMAYETLSFGFDLAWEHAVDAMARPWAEKMPIIKWPVPSKAVRHG